MDGLTYVHHEPVYKNDVSVQLIGALERMEVMIALMGERLEKLCPSEPETLEKITHIKKMLSSSIRRDGETWLIPGCILEILFGIKNTIMHSFSRTMELEVYTKTLKNAIAEMDEDRKSTQNIVPSGGISSHLLLCSVEVRALERTLVAYCAQPIIEQRPKTGWAWIAYSCCYYLGIPSSPMAMKVTGTREDYYKPELQYINQLSKYLSTAARYLGHTLGEPVIAWAG